MAVVTHGSFDEGPIVLALPPVYEYAAAEEVDPIFTAWDRSDGITINQSQISDGSTIINTDDLMSLPSILSTDDITALDDITAGGDLRVVGTGYMEGNVIVTGTIIASNLSGTNTGNQSLTGLVPYTGATGDVDLGVHNLAVGMVTIDNSPTNPTDAATRGYVDSVVTSGIAWQASVKDIVSSLPGGAGNGDRYIHSTDNKINQWNGASWDVTVPTTGMTVFVEGDIGAPVNNIGNHTYNGSAWIYIGSSINHNDTQNIQGGTVGQRWHLSAPQLASITITIDDSDLADVTGLTMSDSGISMVAGHQAAWVELEWDANVESSLDHYIVYYKQHGFSKWSESYTSTNSVRIEGLIPGIDYDFAVSAVNKNGNVTSKSSTLTATMAADTDAPATVVGVTATGAIQAVLLRWTHNTDIDLSHYNIYRNTVDNSAGAIKIASYQGNAFMDNGPIVSGTIGLTVGTTYYYWLKGVDFGGKESDSFSTVASATTRNIIATDIVNIGASQVIIQGLTTIASLFSPGVTTIDGSNITTGTVKLNTLEFNVPRSDQIVATINASKEGIEIDTNLFRVNGTSIFSEGLPSTGISRIYIYPNSTTGIEVIDDLGNNVFKAEIGGSNVGDVTIGDYTNTEGIFYDKSAHTTTFKGHLNALSGTIAGILNFGTAAEQFNGSSMNMDIQGCSIWENTYAGDGSEININVKGYNQSSNYYRNFAVYDGKGSELLKVYGSTRNTEIHDSLTITGDITNGGYLKIPVVTTTQRVNSLPSPAYGMMVFDTNAKTICIVVNINGTPTWYKLDSRSIY
jgi:hypothetical protein